MFKALKQAFCKHDFKRVKVYTLERRLHGQVIEERDKITLYCPKCDAKKDVDAQTYVVELETENKILEIKNEYLKSKKEKVNNLD